MAGGDGTSLAESAREHLHRSPPAAVVVVSGGESVVRSYYKWEEGMHVLGPVSLRRNPRNPHDATATVHEALRKMNIDARMIWKRSTDIGVMRFSGACISHVGCPVKFQARVATDPTPTLEARKNAKRYHVESLEIVVVKCPNAAPL